MDGLVDLGSGAAITFEPNLGKSSGLNLTLRHSTPLESYRRPSGSSCRSLLAFPWRLPLHYRRMDAGGGAVFRTARLGQDQSPFRPKDVQQSPLPFGRDSGRSRNVSGLVRKHPQAGLFPPSRTNTPSPPVKRRQQPPRQHPPAGRLSPFRIKTRCPRPLLRLQPEGEHERSGRPPASTPMG